MIVDFYDQFVLGFCFIMIFFCYFRLFFCLVIEFSLEKILGIFLYKKKLSQSDFFLLNPRVDNVLFKEFQEYVMFL